MIFYMFLNLFYLSIFSWIFYKYLFDMIVKYYKYSFSPKYSLKKVAGGYDVYLGPDSLYLSTNLLSVNIYLFQLAFFIHSTTYLTLM